MKQYQQCGLRQGNTYQVAWIEQRGAKMGASVELLPSRELWEVVAVYAHKLPEDQLKEMQIQHRGSLASIEPMAPNKKVGIL